MTWDELQGGKTIEGYENINSVPKHKIEKKRSSQQEDTDRSQANRPENRGRESFATNVNGTSQAGSRASSRLSDRKPRRLMPYCRTKQQQMLSNEGASSPVGAEAEKRWDARGRRKQKGRGCRTNPSDRKIEGGSDQSTMA